ncbi:hypothetical protein JCM9279_003109 [Rhodotorula babjevae]
MPSSGRFDHLDHSDLDRAIRLLPSLPPQGLGTNTADRPTVIIPLRPERERSEGTLGPSSLGRKGSLRQGRRGRSEGGAHDELGPVTSLPSEDESGAADRIGLARLRQVSAAASSTSHLSLSRTDTRLSTATAETSDAASVVAAAEPFRPRPIPIRPRLDRRRSSTGAVTATPNADDGRLLLVSTSLPARPRKQSSFASATAAPFSNLVAVLPDDVAASSVKRELRAGPPPRPLRSVSTTIVQAVPPKVLKRKASVTTRGRYGGERVEPLVVASRTTRRPSTANAAVESNFPSPFLPPTSSSSYPSHSASTWLPPTPAPVFATAPLDLVSTASSSTEALPRTSSCQRHSRGRSQGRARSKSKPKPRAESTSTSAASASETDSAAGSATATGGSSASTSKTGTIRSGLLKLRKSTASLRNAFRPSRLDIPPLPPPRPTAQTSSTSSAAAPLGLALPLSPIRTAASQPSLVSSVAGAAVDHAALALEHEPESLSPTTPRASRRLGAPSSRPTLVSENVPPVPALPVAAQQEVRGGGAA